VATVPNSVNPANKTMEIRKPRRATKTLAADQSLSKPLEITPEEAKFIAEEGYKTCLNDGYSTEYAERFRRETEERLLKPLGW